MTENRSGFLRRIRARMRLAWLSATAQRFAPFVGLAIVVILTVDWLTDFDQGSLLSGLLIAGFGLGLLVGAAVLRITPWDASRAAERGLGARDALTTALEFTDPADGVHRLIQERADRLAVESRASEAIPIRADGSRLRQVGMASALALVIGLLPPLGSTPAMSSDLSAALEEEAQQVERIADAVEEADLETSDEIAAELERLANELRSAETLEQALLALEEAETRLGERVDADFLSQKTAVQGLARDLALRPLIDGAPVDASSQLEALAENLESLSDPELAALADRLSDLAESQSAGNAALSSQLSEAARALGSGDLDSAARALQQAAVDQQDGLDGARGQQALSETQRALEGARSRLSGDGFGQGQGANEGQEGGQDGSGEGQGQGEGEGGGQGEGDGQGQGPGQGQGGQPAGGGGDVSGVTPGDGTAQGQGGPGNVGAGDGQDHDSDVATANVFSPIEEGALSDLLQVDIEGGQGEGDILGRADAPTARGDSVVPYAQVLPEYLNQAADALGELQLPPSMRSIVQTYFDLLANEAR